jgi:hypothetical protein
VSPSLKCPLYFIYPQLFHPLIFFQQSYWHTLKGLRSS